MHRRLPSLSLFSFVALTASVCVAADAAADTPKMAVLDFEGGGASSLSIEDRTAYRVRIFELVRSIGFEPFACDAKCLLLTPAEVARARTAFEHVGDRCLVSIILHGATTQVGVLEASCDRAFLLPAIDSAFAAAAPKTGMINWLKSKLGSKEGKEEDSEPGTATVQMPGSSPATTPSARTTKKFASSGKSRPLSVETVQLAEPTREKTSSSVSDESASMYSPSTGDSRATVASVGNEDSERKLGTGELLLKSIPPRERATHPTEVRGSSLRGSVTRVEEKPPERRVEIASRIEPATEPVRKRELVPGVEARKDTRVRTQRGEKIITEGGTIEIHDDGDGRAGDDAGELLGGARASKRERERPLHTPPQTSGLKAGAADDNLQFNAFLRFLAENRVRGVPHDVSRRVMLNVRDQKGMPLANARVMLRSPRGESLLERATYADGRAMLFPSESVWLRDRTNRLIVQHGSAVRDVEFQPNAHKIDIEFPIDRPEYSQVPIDIAFVLDTTGSMGDEIERLKKTIDVIHYQITQQTPKPDVRFGMVLYRDREDDYVTSVVPFTRDVMQFRYELHDVYAGGGGDTPEDVQSALDDTIHKLDWRNEGARIAFLIGDAAPHLDYGQTYTYAHAMRDAARNGIKIAAIGASGLPRDGEVVWRQIAQYTMSPFVFLTRGETGDSEGTASSVSHHVGSNWVADNLDAIVIRMVKVELAHFAPNAAPSREDYFSAASTPAMTNELVLGDLFQQSVKQLTDYAIERLDDRTPTLMLPIAPKEKQHRTAANKLERHLALALARDRAFQLVEKEKQGALLVAMTDQFTARYDEAKWLEVGKLVPARFAISGELGMGTRGDYELVVKLIRLETGEVLSLSLMKVDRALLL